jgi:hypothetical protein
MICSFSCLSSDYDYLPHIKKSVAELNSDLLRARDCAADTRALSASCVCMYVCMYVCNSMCVHVSCLLPVYVCMYVCVRTYLNGQFDHVHAFVETDATLWKLKKECIYSNKRDIHACMNRTKTEKSCAMTAQISNMYAYMKRTEN